MMKVTVLLSVVHDTELVMERDWEEAAPGRLDISYTRRVPDLFDEAAAEYALRLRSERAARGEQTRLTGLLRGSAPESLIKNLFAVGFERLVLLPCGEALPDPARIAEQAAEWIRSDGGCDCLFLGQMDSVSCDLTLPGRLAALLALPYTGFVSDLQLAGDHLRVKRRGASGWLCAETNACGVFGFYNAEHAFLRLATLREKLAVSGMRAEKAGLLPCPAPSAPQLTGLQSAMQRRCCRLLDASDPAESARQVWEWMLREEAQHA